MRGGFFIVDVVMAGIGRVALRALLFALAAFAVANPASAEVLTYTFDPFTHFTFEDLDGASLMGTFTVNPPGDGLSSFDIVVGGTGQEAGTYEPEESGATTCSCMSTPRPQTICSSVSTKTWGPLTSS